jgi:phospholipid/cholesterol/gamma-HCH transport system ATP-binding protein
MTSPGQPVLKFDHVFVVLDGREVLRDVSFQLPVGETRVIFGEAGSGKSILLKTALGLIRASTGRVMVFDDDITRLDEQQLLPIRARMGVLFQEGGLFDSMTIEENVSYPILNSRAGDAALPDPDKLTQRVTETLKFVGLDHTLAKFPSELSGGMRRRVGIARAMVTDPPLMLYDSPTAGLDPITATTIMTLILKARDTSNTTSMIVTHRYQDGHMLANFRYNRETEELEPLSQDHPIRQKTRFMVFREGQLIFEGTQQELEESPDPHVSEFKSRGN